MKTRTHGDGTIEYRFRQSWFGTFNMCPDRARRDVDAPRTASDATAMGTAMHAGVEEWLAGVSFTDCQRAVVDTYWDEAELEGYKMVQMSDHDAAIRKALELFEIWGHHIEPRVGDIESIEHTFEHTIAERPRRDGTLEQLTITGTWDAAEVDGPIWDWKTAGRKYQPWEVERWYHQPTFYTLARAMDRNDLVTPQQFNFGIAFKSPQKLHHTYDSQLWQIVEVERGPQDWAVLIDQLWRIVDMAEAMGDSPWPVNDQHALCSKKWCPYWDTCKGAPLPFPSFGRPNGGNNHGE